MKHVFAVALLAFAQQGFAATPQAENDPEPVAPGATYETVAVGEDSAGPFTTQAMDLGTALNYPSRAGVINVMESIVDEPEYTGYVAIEKAYKFGPTKYVLVISTGEGGNACPASTYVFTFDTRTEKVDGKSAVEGCSEGVETQVEGNELTIRKNGAATVVSNAVVE